MTTPTIHLSTEIMLPAVCALGGLIYENFCQICWGLYIFHTKIFALPRTSEFLVSKLRIRRVFCCCLFGRGTVDRVNQNLLFSCYPSICKYTDILENHFTSPHLTTPNLTSPHLIISPQFISPRLISLHFNSPQPTSPNPTTPHPTVSHLISPRLT